MGGSSNPDYHHDVTCKVLTVNLATKKVGEAADTTENVNGAAAAASLNRIALCGGERGRKPLKCCQIYSPRNDRYVIGINK